MQQGGSQSGTGLAPNLAGALSYFLGLVTGVVFVILEKDPFVRFHAFQSILLTVAWVVFWIAFSILSMILAFIPVVNILVGIIGIIMSLVMGLGGLVLWIVLMLKAYQGASWKLPYIGDMAEKYAAQQ